MVFDCQPRRSHNLACSRLVATAALAVDSFAAAPFAATGSGWLLIVISVISSSGFSTPAGQVCERTVVTRTLNLPTGLPRGSSGPQRLLERVLLDCTTTLLYCRRQVKPAGDNKAYVWQRILVGLLQPLMGRGGWYVFNMLLDWLDDNQLAII